MGGIEISSQKSKDNKMKKENSFNINFEKVWKSMEYTGCN